LTKDARPLQFIFMRYLVVLGLAELGVFLFLWGRNLQARIHMRNKAYDLLLSTLLSHRVPEMSAEQIASANFHILDARAYREFEVSYLEGATWVGYDNFDTGRLAGINKQATVAAYCSVGYRSERIAKNYIDRAIPMWSMSMAASLSGSIQDTLW